MKNMRNAVAHGLISPRPNPKQLPPELLFSWLSRPRNPVFTSSDPLTKMFIKAMFTGKPANFIYAGGSMPGVPRTVHVSLVFQHEPGGRIYVAGYCPERSANRVFSLDLMMVIHARNFLETRVEDPAQSR